MLLLRLHLVQIEKFCLNRLVGMIVNGRELYCLRGEVYGSYTMAVT